MARFALWGLIAAAVGKALAALASLLIAPLELARQPVGSISPAQTFATIFVFAAGGIWLLLGGRGDRRARDLGVLFLLLASEFTNLPIERLSLWLGPDLRPVARFLSELELDALVPLFLWRFAYRFPHPPSRRLERRIAEIAIRATGALGIALVAVNLLGLVEPLRAGALGSLLALTDRDVRGSIYHVLVLPQILPGLAMILLRLRRESGEDLRRVRLFLCGLLLGFVPLFVAVFAEVVLGRLVPPLGAWVVGHRPALMAVVFPLFWTVPLISAYAVLVHRVLDVRLIARRILEYALAQATVVVFVALPFVAVGLYLWVHRRLRIEEVFSGAGLLELALVILLGFVMLLLRRRILDAIDRRYFREQYDARQILTELVERIRGATGPEDLANMILGGVDRALHLTTSALLLEDHRSGSLEDPRRRARGLDLSSALASWLAGTSDAVEVDVAEERSPAARLPESDRHWLVDTQFRLLVPIQGESGTLVGIIGLGDKKSELPFLREDRRLLVDIARTAALGLELHSSREREAERPIEERSPSERESHEAARECPQCGSLSRSALVYCGNCSHRLESAPIPYVLPGRYRFEQRLGIGGMGVVYRGTDLALGRPIAAKTLRRVSPEDAIRLRREARTAARVSHPHLAAVYGIETWLGTPIMIFEYLARGTLADRLANGPLSALETVDLGIAMAGALDRLHAAEILHRDVKPSNIGYAEDGSPKLMDFGIARLRFDSTPERPTAAGEGAEASGDPSLLPPTWIGGRPGSPAESGSIGGSVEASRLLAGTLPYLAPEVLNDGTPDAAADLWSLSIVLYECLLGRKVFDGSDEKQVRVRIQLGRVPDLLSLVPEAPPPFAEFFQRALHRSRSARPDSARELMRQLVALRGKLARSSASIRL